LKYKTNDIPLFVTTFHWKRWPIPEVPFTIRNQMERTLLTSWINVLLLCVPIGLGLNAAKGPSVSTFIINYIAEIPLWFMCDYALEEMEKYLRPVLSDLIDIFTTNTVQVISSFLLLLKTKQPDLLQTSLVGGILSNILFLLGLSLVIGGTKNHHQSFNRLGAQGSSSLLSIAATSILIPTTVKLLGQTSEENLYRQSRGVAVILLLTYIAYTFCQMHTHRRDYYSMTQGQAEEKTRSSSYNGAVETVEASRAPPRLQSPVLPPAAGDQVAPRSRVATTERNEEVVQPTQPWASRENRHHEIQGPQLSLAVAAASFATSIVALYFCIDATVDSISVLTERTSLPPLFVGLILLPIPNCDFAPISLAADDLLEQTMRYTVGRSVQTALLVEPVVVLLAWAAGGTAGVPDVTLAFDGFEVVSLFTTIILLNFLMVDAKVHWVHGILLLADWVLIGIAAYFVSPGSLK